MAVDLQMVPGTGKEEQKEKDWKSEEQREVKEEKKEKDKGEHNIAMYKYIKHVHVTVDTMQSIVQLINKFTHMEKHDRQKNLVRSQFMTQDELLHCIASLR